MKQWFVASTKAREESRALFNLKQQGFRDIWFGERALRLSDSIIQDKCYCTHECALSSSLLFNPSKAKVH